LPKSIGDAGLGFARSGQPAHHAADAIKSRLQHGYRAPLTRAGMIGRLQN
jgi:hypothetical protein